MSENLEKWIADSLVVWKEKMKDFPRDHYARMPLGYWLFAYKIEEAYIRPQDIKQTVQEGRSAKTGWPPFWVPTRPEIRPEIMGEVLECWLGKFGKFQDSAHSDFWRVSSKGEGILIRGYQEDGQDGQPESHGKVFDLTLPIWRLGEVLLQANNMAEVLGHNKKVEFIVSWRGLKGRELISMGNRRRIIHDGFICKQDEVNFKGEFISNSLEENLYHLVTPAIELLFKAFELNNYDPRLILDETFLMLSNRFGNE